MAQLATIPRICLRLPRRLLLVPARPILSRAHVSSSSTRIATYSDATPDTSRDNSPTAFQDPSSAIDPDAQPKPRSRKSNRIHPAFERVNEPHRYVTTLPPTDAQLRRADYFFSRAPSRYAFTCHEFRAFPPDSMVPEVAFVGRSNAGKSSLLNTLFGRHSSAKNKDTAHVSKKPGRTSAMNVYLAGLGAEGGMRARVDEHGKPQPGPGVGWIAPKPNTLAFVDMPGYGYGSKRMNGTEIVKYLTGRKQLRRVFVLINLEHGMKDDDVRVLQLLQMNGVPHQIVGCKTDKKMALLPTTPRVRLEKGLARLVKVYDELTRKLNTIERGTKGTPALKDILAVSSVKSLGHEDEESAMSRNKLGINGLRWAILQATGIMD